MILTFSQLEVSIFGIENLLESSKSKSINQIGPADLDSQSLSEFLDTELSIFIKSSKEYVILKDSFMKLHEDSMEFLNPSSGDNE